MSFLDRMTVQDCNAITPHQDASAVPLLGHEAAHFLNALFTQTADMSDPRLVDRAVALLIALVGAFDEHLESRVANVTIAALDPCLASIMADLLVLSASEGREARAEDYSDSYLICIASLLGASDRRLEALTLLDDGLTFKSELRFIEAAYQLRCRILGASPDIADMWTLPIIQRSAAEWAEIEAVDPLSVEIQRGLFRALANENRLDEAVKILGVALALPVPPEDKAILVEDIAVLLAHTASRGRRDILNETGIRYALTAHPDIARRASSFLQNLGDGDLPALTERGLYFARALLDEPGHSGRSAFPIVNGRPYIDIVWLEITNFCNQKCSFCPDPLREGRRQWLPLATIKRIIDDLHANVSVGSMQLNAYGEPLLHPQIDEILKHLNDQQVPWPVYFTTHGLTLVEKKLSQLSHNYPAGIAVSLHNDSQESYAATRSAKVGDYETLVARVEALLAQMVEERAPSHVRLYQMVSNGAEDKRLRSEIRSAFPSSPERMIAHVRKWEAIAAKIAGLYPAARGVIAHVNSDEAITASFLAADQAGGPELQILSWVDGRGTSQRVFMSPRAVCTYANLLLDQDPDWRVDKHVVTGQPCFFVKKPSLAIFATGKLGICCVDLESTAIFGALDDYPDVGTALRSPEALRLFSELSNGIATSKGCQICLADGKQGCSKKAGAAC